MINLVTMSHRDKIDHSPTTITTTNAASHAADVTPISLGG